MAPPGTARPCLCASPVDCLAPPALPACNAVRSGGLTARPLAASPPTCCPPRGRPLVALGGRGRGAPPIQAPRTRAGPVEAPDDSPAQRGEPRWSLWMVADSALLYPDTRRQAQAGSRPLGGDGPAEGTLPLRGPHRTLRQRPGARPRCGGRPLGKLSGGNRMAARVLRAPLQGPPVGGLPPPAYCSAPLARGAAAARPRRSG